MEAVKVGKRGTIVVPAKLRKRYGMEEGTLVTTEPREDGLLIRPAIVVPVERYTPERKAEFLLSTATTTKDYRRARKEVQKLGLNPDAIPHRPPPPVPIDGPPLSGRQRAFFCSLQSGRRHASVLEAEGHGSVLLALRFGRGTYQPH